MTRGVAVEIWGDRGCFTRPELSVERMSYDCITPSAAVGILESVYWHPPMKYVIDKIHVLNPVMFMTVRTNELKSKAQHRAMMSAMVGTGMLPHIDRRDDIQQRTSTILRDVRYVVEAHFEVSKDEMGEGDSSAKFISILKRRLAKGQCWQQPYLGIREYAAHIRLYEGKLPPQGYYAQSGEKDLGLMLYGMDYHNPEDITPMFYRAIMRDGTIDVAGSEVYR